VICGAVFIPSTPLLVGVVASGAEGELREVRDATRGAFAAAVTAAPDRVVVVGAGHGSVLHRGGWGSLRGFGVAYDVPLDPADRSAGPRDPRLPLSLTLGAWLLAEAGWTGERAALEIDLDAGDPELDALGRDLAADASRTLLLVVADGSAARTEKAPASLHPDAASFDAGVAAALASGDPAALSAVDRDAARTVTAAGRPAWRVVAAAMSGRTYDAELLVDQAPYGVGYLVARWHP
jgi:hypothetical protein